MMQQTEKDFFPSIIILKSNQNKGKKINFLFGEQVKTYYYFDNYFLIFAK